MHEPPTQVQYQPLKSGDKQGGVIHTSVLRQRR